MHKILLMIATVPLFWHAAATEPVEWMARPGDAPRLFNRHHGSTLAVRCTFSGFGSAFAPGADVRLWYQTNGMAAAWWSVPASVSSNVITATFGPEADVGADRYALCIGAPSNAYASAVLKLMPSPGFTPSLLPPPIQLLDFAAIPVTNAPWLTPPEVDARIAELAPQGLTTNDVCDIVTNEVPHLIGYTEWELYIEGEKAFYSFDLAWNGTEWYAVIFLPSGIDDFGAGGTFDSVSLPCGIVEFRREAIYERHNALGLAYRSDVPTNTSQLANGAGFVTESYLGDLVGPLADKVEALSNKVSTAGNAVGVLWRYVYGDTVWIAVTNYMRMVNGIAPSLQLWEVRNGTTNCVYWSREEITNVTAGLIHDCKTNLEATVAAATNATPDKAWSKYQSATGAENPQHDRITIISTPAIMLTGGGEWYEYVSTGGSSTWVLRSNGLAKFGGDTNGFFRVEDDEGKAQFEVINTAERTLDARVSDTGWDGNGNFVVTYNWTDSTQPKLYAKPSLDAPGVGEENGEINALGITVEWERVGGYWTATVLQDTRAPRLFIYAKVTQPGVKAVVNRAPTQLDGGLIVDGAQYRIVPYATGGKTYLTLEAVQ